MANTPRSGSNKPENTGAGGIHFATDTHNAGQHTGSGAAGALNQGKQAATGLAEQARDTASNLGQQAKDAASNLASKASDVASNVGQKAGDAKSSVGGGMKSLAGTLRENAPNEGVAGQAASAVARSLEAGGSYLQQNDFGDIADDLTGVIRRYPVPAVLIGIGIGFLLAKATRS